MTVKKVSFRPVSQEAQHIVPRPVPAKDVVPQWFKSIPVFSGSNAPEYSAEGIVNKTVKMCVPFSDSFRMGYIQCTWMDLQINPSKDGSGNIEIISPGKPTMLGARENSDVVKKVSTEYHPLELVWKTQWMPLLPPGYSAIITHPFNREELPFTTLTGIVDYDTYHHDSSDNNLAFLLKKGFTGRIPIGTPMYQIIPFKRDEWESEELPYLETQPLDSQKLYNRFLNAYKHLFWSKKSFK